MKESVKKEIKNLINILNLNCSIEEFKNKINWRHIYQELSEDFIREFQHEVDWFYISKYQNLSDEFTYEFRNKIDWSSIAVRKRLSEDFIRKFNKYVNWLNICQYQSLSEDFIREFRDQVHWSYISKYQNLSENFIREFENRVNWFNISTYQQLSENFIREFKIKLHWTRISKYQKLSENFIREFKYQIDWDYIIYYQKLSSKFRKEFNLKILKHNWLYKTKEWKLNWIKKHTDYEVVDNQYIIAYKSVKKDGYSVFNRQFQYEIGNTYEDFHCDCNSNIDNSFGLSAWYKQNAKEYYDYGKLLKVKINIEDIGCIVPSHNNKIRCWKLTILEEVEK